VGRALTGIPPWTARGGMGRAFWDRALRSKIFESIKTRFNYKSIYEYQKINTWPIADHPNKSIT
jgi:hypothetical protein